LLLSAIAVLAAIAGNVPANAGQFFGLPVIVKADGNVTATFVDGAGAGLNNDVYLESPPNSLGIIFNNHSTTVGTMVDLGTFTAGTELLFRMHVNGDTPTDYFTGPASRNPDNFPHARLDDLAVDNQLLVGFEDLAGGGDQNYNDATFSLTNAVVGEVPEPGTAALAVIAVAVGALRARRRPARIRR
jgi:uncharacterized protein (TIGR03382 family)